MLKAAKFVALTTTLPMTGRIFLERKKMNHYNHPSGIDCWQIVKNLGFVMGSIIKYVWRYDKKNGIEDLKTALDYADRSECANPVLPFDIYANLLHVIEAEPDPFKKRFFQVIIDTRFGENSMEPIRNILRREMSPRPGPRQP